MTMGLTLAPDTFPHFMTDIFQDLSKVFVVVHLDDILVYPELENIHQGHVRCAPMPFSEHNHHVKPGIAVKQIQSAIGFTNFYHRFIVDFSGAVTPLNCLTHRDAKFSWGLEQQQVFKTLKLTFIQALVLTYFDPAHPIVVGTDASDNAMAAINSQVSPDNRDLHPIAFYPHWMKPPLPDYLTMQNISELNQTLLSVGTTSTLVVLTCMHWMTFITSG